MTNCNLADVDPLKREAQQVGAQIANLLGLTSDKYTSDDYGFGCISVRRRPEWFYMGLKTARWYIHY